MRRIRIRPASPHLVPSMAGIAAITGWRLLCLWLTPLDLFMDEAQYWLWSREPAFGYFSKPPLIGWVIRAITALTGAETTFTVRLAAPLGHAMAAVFVALAARAYWQSDAALWAGAAYATLPGVAVLGLFVSTDDLLLAACAAALWALIRLRQGAAFAGWSALLGTALGLGMLAKYAMLYIAVAVAAQAAFTRDRQLRRACIAALLLGLIIVLPNLIWNIRAGFVTLGHTAGNAGWQGVAWNWAGLAGFLAVQALAFGPVFAAGYLPSLGHAMKRRAWPIVALSAGILAAVALQALIRAANGNWAAPAFIAGAVLTVPWCLSHWPRLTAAGMVLNAAFSVLLPAATLRPDMLHLGGRPVFARIEEPSRFNTLLQAAARRESAVAIVSDDRMTLATLSWRLREDPIRVYALPPVGAPQNHYEMTRPAPQNPGRLLLVVARLPAGCTGRAKQLALGDTETQAAYRAKRQIYVLDGPCWG